MRLVRMGRAVWDVLAIADEDGGSVWQALRKLREGAGVERMLAALDTRFMSDEEVNDEHSLSYWITLARMGFENDFQRLFNELGISRAELAKRIGTSPEYVTKVLNGAAGNFQLSTMAKWARALGAIVQVRLIKEGEEVVRVVDYETAGQLDDRSVEQKEQPSIEGFSVHRERFKASTA